MSLAVTSEKLLDCWASDYPTDPSCGDEGQGYCKSLQGSSMISPAWEDASAHLSQGGGDLPLEGCKKDRED